jgi:hypothetical protein
MAYTQNVNSCWQKVAASALKKFALSWWRFLFLPIAPICYSPRLKSLSGEKWPCRAVFAGHFSALLVKYRGQLIKPRRAH